MRKSKSIAVVGGTGFLGSRICREASLRGLTVVSLSRSPPLPSLLSHSWAQRVDWRAADVLGSSAGSEGKAEWKALFEGRDAVVHCVGQLLADGTYKDALKNRDPLKLVGIAANGAKEVVGGLAGAAYNVAQSVSSGRASSTPSFAGGGSSSSFGAPSWTSSSSSSSSFGSASNTQMLYAVNRDSALVTANAAADAKVGQFVFVSAAELFPFQTDYVKSKRQAERMIMDPSTYNFTSVIFRPGLMYSDSRPPTLPIAGVLNVLSTLSAPLKSLVPRAANFPLPVKPLHVDVVARAIVEEIENGGGSGIRDVDEIESLGD